MNESDQRTVPDDNSRLEKAMEEYLAMLEEGIPVNRQEFLGQYPSIRAELSEQLKALEYLQLAKSDVVDDPFKSQIHEGEAIGAGATLGDFQLIRPIGRGGMAVVYEAKQLSLGRTVAVKILPFAAILDDQQLIRFQNESRAAAALDHPGIVPIHFVGQHQGVHFFAMQLVEGQSVADLVAKLQTEQRKSNTNDHFRFSADIGIQVCEALQHAHEQGVVHRDVKPSNLLIHENERVVLSDFGLARFDGAESVTRTGDVVGTLDYMSPEQLSGSTFVDSRSDVYSLGVTLFELISLQKPFDSGGRRERFDYDSRMLRMVDKRIPDDLETIVSKAMSEEPGDRYVSAAEMRADLARYRDGKPILARRPSLVDRVAKWARRHKKLSTGIAITALCIGVALSVATLLVWQAQQNAQASLGQAAVQTKKVERLLYVRSIQSAFQAWNRDHESQAREILRTFVTDDAEKDQRGFEWYALNSLVRAGQRRILGKHNGPVHQIALFPGGNRVASVGADKILRIWDLSKRQLVREIDVDAVDSSVEPLFSVAVSPDGKWLVTGSDEVLLWDIATGKMVRRLTRFNYNVASLAFSPDGKRVAAAARYDRIRLLTLDGTLVNEVDSPSRNESLLFSGDGKAILCPFRIKGPSKKTNFVRSWKADLSGVRKDYGDDGCFSVDASKSGEFLLIAESYKGAIRLMETGSGKLIDRLPMLHGRVKVVAISPCESRIATGFGDGGVICWRIVKNDRGQIVELVKLRRFQAHEGEVSSVRFTQDGNLVTCGADGKINLLTLMPDANPNLRAFASVWRMDASATSDFTVAVVDGYVEILQGGSRRKIPGELGGTRLVRLSKSKRAIAVTRTDRILEVIALPLFDSMGTIQTDFTIDDVKFSPNESQLVIVGGDGALALYSAETLQLQNQRQVDGEYESPRYHCAFSPDERSLVCGGDFKAIAVVDLKESALLRQIPVVSQVTCLAFSHDGGYLLSCHADGLIRLWEWPTGQLVGALVGHGGEVNSAVFSRDGSVIASTGTDGTCRLWSVSEKLELGILLRRPTAGRVIEFSNNDTTLHIGFDGMGKNSLASFYFDEMPSQ